MKKLVNKISSMTVMEVIIAVAITVLLTLVISFGNAVEFKQIKTPTELKDDNEHLGDTIYIIDRPK